MSGRIDLPAIRRGNPLASVAGASVKLTRRGDEYVACCPFHEDDTPSFTIFAGGERFHCFGCGADGDVLDFVRLAHGVGFRDAAAMLAGRSMPMNAAATPPPRADKPERVAKARAIWRAAVKPQGTPVEAYLRLRGLTLPLPDSIRFARLRYGADGPCHPCMVAAVASADRKLTGIQRTYLTEAGEKAFGAESKRSLGIIAGGAIRCAPAGVKGLIVTEGLEDALTLQQVLGRAAWAAAGASMLPAMRFPAGVRSIVIGADGDAAGGREAAKAADALTRAGLAVRIIRPRDGVKDFNAELLEALP